MYKSWLKYFRDSPHSPVCTLLSFVHAEYKNPVSPIGCTLKNVPHLSPWRAAVDFKGHRTPPLESCHVHLEGHMLLKLNLQNLERQRAGTSSTLESTCVNSLVSAN